MNSSRYFAPITIALASFLLGAIAVSMVLSQPFQTQRPNAQPQNFTQCAAAGYPIMESYPRRCRIPNGATFVEPVSNPISAPSPTPTSTLPQQPATGCIIGGCSRELCTDASAGAMMSSCIFRAEFACYKTATCERQSNGVCGWTPTPSLKSCLQNPPSLR